MTGLQETFYIMGIVFMGIMFLLMIGLVIGVFIIKSKINKIHDNIERKIDSLTSVAERGGELTALAGAQVMKQAKKVLSKAKK